MKKYLIGILLIIICQVLTSCAYNRNFTQMIASQLQPTELIETYHTSPPDLAARSKCPSPPSVRIVNAETNDQNYTFYTLWPNEWQITPKKLVDDIVIYMSDAFNRTGIKTDQESKNVIKVSLEKMTSTETGWWNYSTNTQLKIMIPEKNFTQIYGHYDTTPRGPNVGAAYNIHVITWKIINDPFMQDYILCR